MFGGNKKLKVLLITVAGLSRRFSESIENECLKCLYYKNDFSESLLYNMIRQTEKFDKYIIVGGYKFDELKQVITEKFDDIKDKIILVKNDYYAEYGSGYSLYIGLKEALNIDYNELIFAEGDLFVDNKSFMEVYNCENNVITCNKESILANKAVAFYYDMSYGVHYIYDTSHKALCITEPFLGIFNSGQIWKFIDSAKLKYLTLNLDDELWQGTNLNLIQEYFGNLSKEDYEIIMFDKWINCNTISDFENI